MKIQIILHVPEEEDVDETADMGLTFEAYDRLYNAITDVGFEFVGGPKQLAD